MKSILDFSWMVAGVAMLSIHFVFCFLTFSLIHKHVIFLVKSTDFWSPLTAFRVAILYSAEHLLLIGHFLLDVATG